ncbi:hypothetical protein [Agrococcus casei]|uniref:Uncharacterized protein n=1 Tax=Agrococcus casei LMG 22410 TaxID=1255656 RepID=A0A1R4G6L2_9MICO|nr:hypothetical protein [Agrococcus casei]SJM63786.1 hypothetical protein CZ674_09325 [Agrococcus casei LMG 22410]
MSAPSLAASPGPTAVRMPVVAAIRRLIITMAVSLLLGSLLLTSSKGRSLGGVNSDGQWLDEFGELSAQAPETIQLTLHPSPLGVIAAFVVLLWALGRVMRGTRTDAEAVAFLRKVERWFIIALVVGVVYSQLLFWITPIEGWGAAGGFWLHPFPFATIDVSYG